MQILIFPNPEVVAILNEQPIYNDIKYRWFNHVLMEDVDGGKLIFNSLTRSLIHLTYKEFSEVFNDKLKYELLYRAYFLVPENFNDMEVIDDVREHFKTPIDDMYLDKVNSFVILPTTKCNARCFYCYELHEKGKKHMSLETAKEVAEYIMKTVDITQPINLCWFGGEPLFNMPVIDLICNTLKDNGYFYTSGFVSNAILLDEKVINKAKNLWNIDRAQITIDGTEAVYNKTKNYIYKDIKSPYKKILNNIALLLNNNITVSVRMNIDLHNSEDLKDLVWECKNRFKNHSKFSMYAYPIFENADYSRNEEQRDLVFKKLAELEKVMLDCGYYYGEPLRTIIRAHQCIADSGDSILISPNGDLGTCEHYISSDFWGHIKEPSKKDFEILKGWRVYEKPWEGCKNCPIYGSCLRPSKCEEMRKCDKRYKEWFIRKAIQGMLLFYYNNRNMSDEYIKIE